MKPTAVLQLYLCTKFSTYDSYLVPCMYSSYTIVARIGATAVTHMHNHHDAHVCMRVGSGLPDPGVSHSYTTYDYETRLEV
jgi:hypothetical protein